MATAAAKDFQMDMKEYFDRACNGEDVCVPGNGKENVFSFCPGLWILPKTAVTGKSLQEV